MKAPGNASYETVLTGFVYYASSWESLPGDTNTPMGIYSISAKPGSQPEELGMIGYASSHCNGGAVLVGDTYWYIWRQTDPTGATGIDISQLYSYNIESGESVNHGIVSSELASISDKAWDPVSGDIYGQFKVNGETHLCIVNFKEQELTPIAKTQVYYGLAFNAAGQLYGIDGSGVLYMVDKTTGAPSRIGSTGVSPKSAQSMTFDFKTGDLYWASYTDAGAESSVLYKVNASTAETTLVTVFDDQQEIIGLGAMPVNIADNAPGYVTGLTVATDKASTTAEVSFVLPSYTFMGDELSGEIEWIIKANGNTVKTGKAEAGITISESVTLPEGQVVVSVICSNAAGAGPEANVTHWVGEGFPMAPTGVKFEINEKTGKVNLVWNPVTEGVDGGYIDPSKITYKIVAYPGERTVDSGTSQTAFTETLEEPSAPVDVYYHVSAMNGWRESEATESNHYPYGRGFAMPYNNSFDSSDDLKLFYITDGNGDGQTWEWSHFEPKTAYIFTGTDGAGNQDDWLITPGLDMKAGNRYQITYYTCGNLGGTRFEDYLELGFGIGLETTDYEIVEPKFKYEASGQKRHDVIVIPSEDGYYHFGFHAVSNCVKGLSMYIDDIHVDVLANDKAPSKVTDLSVKTSQGTAPVTFTFKLPKNAVDGSDIESLTKVELWRNHSELVASQDVSVPGKQVRMVDNKGAKGLTIYSIVVYNEYGVGERLETEVYLGLDVPGTPEDVVLIDNGNGSLKLTWNTPKAGASGGYVDSNNLTYNVYVINGGYASDYLTGVKDNEIVINNCPGYYDPDQELIVYGVSAVNSIGEGRMRQSSEVVVGQSYTYPFAESWPGGEEKYEMWYRANSGSSGWLPCTSESSDSDGGSMELVRSQR